MNQSSELLRLIESVTKAETLIAASMDILSRFLQMFEMDQAAFCELRGEEIVPIFAIDRTKKILDPKKDLWLSKTLMQKALASKEPAVHRDEIESKGSIPDSIDEHRIKNVVCFSLTHNPDRVVYLVCRRNPMRTYSKDELAEFQVAAQAAGLALTQHHNFLELKEKAETLGKLLKQQPGFIYFSEEMQKLHKEVERLAPFNVSILIQGESGVGKEEIAKEIHRLSGRSGRFVAVNCANLSENLLESELFGYVKGAFTGAINSKKGLFEEANQGTIFFDEIAELPITLQAKLLRVLQERMVRPVGSLQETAIDVRVLAASHKELKRSIHSGNFREDLYYRLQEFTVVVPPLRDRKGDLEFLAQHFVSQFSREFNLPRRLLGNEALKKLLAHSWPGNIRELKNICRAAVIISRESTIASEDIRVTEMESSSNEQKSLVDLDSSSLKEMTRKFEQKVIQGLLKEPGQNQNEVAKRLDISVRTIQRILNNEVPLV